MLALTRKAGERIYIYPDDLPLDMTVAELFSGGEITIEIINTRAHQVKIGIDVPIGLKIIRGGVEREL
jgi:sRNA-binding carbon storage regulator CsrA